jgi:hypothetical protein
MRESFREHMNAMALKMARPFQINPPTGFSNSGGGGDCPPDTSLRSRQYVSPLFQFVFIPTFNPAVAIPDYQIILPAPAKCIFVASCLEAQNNDSLFLHFVPLNKNYAGATSIAPAGTEQWIQLSGRNASGGTGRMGSGLVFDAPLPAGQPLFFDIGSESGGSSPISILLTNNLTYWHYPGTQGT